MSHSLARRAVSAVALLTAAAVSIATSPPDTLELLEASGELPLASGQTVATQELRLVLELDDAGDADDIDGWLSLSFSLAGQGPLADGGVGPVDPEGRVDVVVRRAGDTGTPLYQGALPGDGFASLPVLRSCRGRTCEDVLVVEVRRVAGTGDLTVHWGGRVATALDPEAGTLELVSTP